MSRTIVISTDVFAAIWALRQPGEETEDAILSRILGCSEKAATTATEAPAKTNPGTVGFNDTRNGVSFPEGFEAIRRYKRREYRAIASNGTWLRPDTGERFGSLNQLNASFVLSASKSEDVWRVWEYRAPDGSVRSIDKLRG